MLCTILTQTTYHWGGQIHTFSHGMTGPQKAVIQLAQYEIIKYTTVTVSCDTATT